MRFFRAVRTTDHYIRRNHRRDRFDTGSSPAKSACTKGEYRKTNRLKHDATGGRMHDRLESNPEIEREKNPQGQTTEIQERWDIPAIRRFRSGGRGGRAIRLLVELSGYSKVGSSGEYRIELKARDGAIIHVHESLVIDADTPREDEDRASPGLGALSPPWTPSGFGGWRSV